MAKIQPTTQSIYALVQKSVNQYVFLKTTISKYVEYSQYETIETVDAYLNSKHISGEKDSLGRDKPFFNIVTAAVNIWYRATQIDRKDIRITATKSSDTVAAFLANVKLQEWMKKERFGVFLKEWGRGLARYGSVVIKFVEKNGRLHIEIIPWNRLVTDVVEFDNAPVIERLYFTPAQLLREKGYDQVQVEALIKAAKTARKDLQGQNKDTKSDFIEVFEVHGELPLSMLTGNAKDDNKYQQQMQVISYVAKNTSGSNGEEYDNFVLAKGREEKPIYMITHLIKEDGRTVAIGAVENLFQAQWMTNHSVKAIKDQLDTASKLVFQTADPDFVGMNILTNVENGDILYHNGAPLTQVANTSHDITSLQNFANQWQMLGQSINSTTDAISGKTPPSGMAYRSVQIANQESHSLFEVMTESKALALEDMLREYIIPFIKRTELANSDEISAILSEYEIKQIDPLYINSEVIKRANAHVVSQFHNNAPDQQIQPPDTDAITQQVQGELSQQGNKRFYKPSDITDKQWAEIIGNIEWTSEIDIAGEDTDKNEVMTTLTTVLQTIATNPAVLQDENGRLLFNKILQASGDVSPLELAPAPAPQPQSQKNNNKVIESLNYKDAPDDIKRQMEQQAGFKPSTEGSTTAATPGTPAPVPPGQSMPSTATAQPVGAT